MAALSFTINPDAAFTSARRSLTRDHLWRRRKPAQPEVIIEQTDVAIPAGESDKAIARRALLSGLVCPSNMVCCVKHSSYKTYLISTTMRGDGTWVASYGRADGAPFPNDGRAVAETMPYLAEVLALADAHAEIDVLRKTAAPPRLKSLRRPPLVRAASRSNRTDRGHLRAKPSIG